jgi:2-iminobutanoate/2-iminopropanoate deaminase
MNKATSRKSSVMTLMASISRIAGLALLFGALTLPPPSLAQSSSGRTAIAPGKFFSGAIIAGDYVFLSGALARGVDGKIVEGGIKDETRQVMENLKAMLEKSGVAMRDVVKVTVFIKNAEDFPVMNEIYQSYFPTEPPARTTVVASFPVKEASVEIEMIAYRGK